jgi:hypothetical protein
MVMNVCMKSGKIPHYGNFQLSSIVVPRICVTFKNHLFIKLIFTSSNHSLLNIKKTVLRSILSVNWKDDPFIRNYYFINNRFIAFTAAGSSLAGRMPAHFPVINNHTDDVF